jgi:Holliday junction resolvase RusA-like endonuclease
MNTEAAQSAADCGDRAVDSIGVPVNLSGESREQVNRCLSGQLDSGRVQPRSPSDGTTPQGTIGNSGISFTVPGLPVPWARAAGGATRARFTPAKQRSAAGAIKLIAQAAMRGARPLEGPVRLEVIAIWPWPKTWSAKKRDGRSDVWKTSRCDVDNVAKLVSDSLNGVAWIDDAQIVDLRAAKLYGDFPKLAVKIEALT